MHSGHDTITEWVAPGGRDKRERQIAVMKYYIDGDQHALDPFPGGSEPGT